MDDIDKLLESTCRTMIRTILACLSNATKGTIYRIGLMPELKAVRITSGSRKPGSDDMDWGLPAASDYNPPGKKWEQYRDQPGRVLEAMGWCVEKQKSWTAENPQEDVRSVRKQIMGEPEDHYHMEPVLVPKDSLYGGTPERLHYPLDWQGNPIWQNSRYVVAAVIKIHFLPWTIKNGDRSTVIIRELSRSLGTELLSLYLRDTLYRARKEFARQRLQSCEILAHELRNTLVKLGFVFSAINAQIAILRESWESLLREKLPGLEWKGQVLELLSKAIESKLPELESSGTLDLGESILTEQKELAKLSLSPYQEQGWVRNKLMPKWDNLLDAAPLWDRTEIHALLERLINSLRAGMDQRPGSGGDGLPRDLIEKWARLAYVHINSGNLFQIDEIIELVESPSLPVAHKDQMARVLKSLRALVLVIPEVEEKATRILTSLRQGSGAEDVMSIMPGVSESRGDFGVALTD